MVGTKGSIFITKTIDIPLLGCVIEINETGTSLKFKPGILVGGVIKDAHDCGLGRSIGWFIEGIIPLLIFCKTDVAISFTGVTNDSLDFSVDILQSVTLPLLQNFGVFGVAMKVLLSSILRWALT